MDRWFANLLAVPGGAPAPHAGEGLEVTFTHTWPWPPWVALVFVILVAVWVLCAYWREPGSAGRPARFALAALRVLLLVTLLIMMYGWMRNRYRTELPDVVIVLDDSQSMNVVDRDEDGALQQRWRRPMDELQLSELSRVNLAKAMLLDARVGWLDRLVPRYTVKLYLLGATARIQSGAAQELAHAVQAAEASEPSSRLGDGLQEILESQRGRPTAAVLLLTDGITTQGRLVSDVAHAARRRGTPLYIVGMGDERPPRDVRVADLLVDETVFLGDAVHFDFKVVGSGFTSEEVTVWLKQQDHDQVLAQQTLTLAGDGTPQSIRLTYRPAEEGEYEFVAGVEPLAHEANGENNVLSQRVRVQDESIRLLYVQEYPSLEFRNLKALLERSVQRPGGRKAIELTTILQEADLEYADLDAGARRVFPVSRDELFGYDVVLFGDVNPSYLSRPVLENLAAFVLERGGGMGFIAGPRHTPLAYRGTPLEDLFGIDLDTATLPEEASLLEGSRRVQPTRLGLATPHLQLADTPAANLALWQSLPGLRWILRAPDTRLATQVVIETVGDAAAGDGPATPVVCLQYAGAGRVVFQATDESYLWSRLRGSDDFYERYWIQTIRFLSRSRLLGTSRQVELATDRERYHRGESVRLQVRFGDERMAPTADDGVVVVIEQQRGRRYRVKLQRDATRRGVFESAVSHLTEGTYRAWLATPSVEGSPPSDTFAVIPPPGEQARLALDAGDLRLAAETSQGRFYTLASATRVPDELPPGRQVRIESLPSVPVWNSPWLAGLCILLLTAEWLLRRRWGWL